MKITLYFPFARRCALASAAIALGSFLSGCGGGGTTGARPPMANPSVPVSGGVGVAPDTNGNDWPEFRRDNQRTGNNPYQTAITLSNVASLKVKWTRNTHGVFASAVVMNNVVYQADDGGALYAWNVSDGSPIWTYTNSPDNVHFNNAFQDTPVFYNNTLYLGDFGTSAQNARFRAINAANGHLLWTYTDNTWRTGAKPSFQGSPLLANGYIYEGQTEQDEEPGVCIPKDQLLALNPSNGALVSALTTTPDAGENGVGIWASPMQSSSGSLYVATANRCDPNALQNLPYADALLALANGGKPPLSVAWAFQSQVPRNSALDLDFGATPVYVNGMVVQGGKDGYTYAVNATTGTLVWKQQTGSVIGSPATDGTRIYVPIYNTVNGIDCSAGQNPCGGLWALNAGNGSVAWKFTVAADKYGNGSYSAPAVSNGIVFEAIGTTVYAFSAASGAVLWHYTTNHIIYQGMAVVNGGLFVGEFDGSGYYCFTPNGT